MELNLILDESYDRLSELGQRQADWLGAHFRATAPHFDRVITGTMTRQADTARAMGFPPEARDPRWNELPYFAIERALREEHRIAPPDSDHDFVHHLPVLMAHWEDEKLRDVPETFADFDARVRAALSELCLQPGRSLVVTSGGVIGAVLRHILALDRSATCAMMLQILNSSVHRLNYVQGRLMLAGFNATPHLDAPQRLQARTYF